MRHYPTDEADKKELAKLNVEPWMVEALRRNPEYPHWGNHEDYMSSKDGGWAAPAFLDTWQEMWKQDDYNELVHGYFFLSRASRECEACEGCGYNPATKQIADDWYDFAGTGRKWCAQITQDEVEALVKEGRLVDLVGYNTHLDKERNVWVRWVDGKKQDAEAPAMPTAAQVNARERGRGLGHDAINRCICIRQRAERLGVYGMCETCDGDGYVYTEPSGHLGLQLWVLHPRKGASRGVLIKDIGQDDLKSIEEYFREALDRTRRRFNGMAGL